MAFFKRIEVWVLLALTVAGVVAVLRMDQSGDRGGDSDSDRATDEAGAGEQDAAPRHVIEGLNIERDGDHAVVEIRLRVGDDEGFAADTEAHLLCADGSEVQTFFVPFHGAMAGEPVGSSSEQQLSLLFWADRAALAGALFLELGGERIAVKGADGFELESLDEGGRRSLPTAMRCSRE
jgi:hypothetical protein